MSHVTLLICLMSGALWDSKSEYLEHSSQKNLKFLHCQRKLYIGQLSWSALATHLFTVVGSLLLMRGLGEQIDIVNHNSTVVRVFLLLGWDGWLELSDYWDWLLCVEFNPSWYYFFNAWSTPGTQTGRNIETKRFVKCRVTASIGCQEQGTCVVVLALN